MLEIPAGKNSLELLNNPLHLNNNIKTLIIFPLNPHLHKLGPFRLDRGITNNEAITGNPLHIFRDASYFCFRGDRPDF